MPTRSGARLLERRTWSERGGPWRWHPGDVDYPPDACLVTVELLRRAVLVEISPDLDLGQVDQMADAIVSAVAKHG